MFLLVKFCLQADTQNHTVNHHLTHFLNTDVVVAAAQCICYSSCPHSLMHALQNPVSSFPSSQHSFKGSKLTQIFSEKRIALGNFYVHCPPQQWTEISTIGQVYQNILLRIIICVLFFPQKNSIQFNSITLLKNLKITSTSSPLLESIIHEYTNIVHFKSLTTALKIVPTSMKNQFSVYLHWTLQVSKLHFCKLHTELQQLLVVMSQIILIHVKLRFKVITEKLPPFSRWMWKQPSSVKLCRYIILYSEAEAFRWSKY